MEIWDDLGKKHFITEQIGEDGQGILYATESENVIVRDAGGIDSLSRLSQYDNVDFIPNIRNFLLPSAYLQEPYLGYVLRIPRNFVPLSTIMSPGNENTAAFYTKTGGFKRRLEILAAIAKILVKLHSIPLMYGSISPCRIFISKDSTNSEAYLLYSAKTDYTMHFAKESDADPYIAPEAKNGMGATLASDSHNMARLAYDLLSLNGSQETIPLKLNAMLRKALLVPESRPKMTVHYRHYLQQLDLLLICKKCQEDFQYGAPVCPLCESPPPKLLKAYIYDLAAEIVIERGFKILEFSSEPQYFWDYHTDNVLLDERVEPRLECLLVSTPERKIFFKLKNLMDKEISVNNNIVKPGKTTTVAMPCEVINIKFKLYSAAERCIDLVII